MTCRQAKITTTSLAQLHLSHRGGIIRLGVDPHVLLRRQPNWRRRPTRSDASHESSQPVDEAAATVSNCLRLATEGQVDALLEHVPDDVLDRCIAMRKSARCFAYQDILFMLVCASSANPSACDQDVQRRQCHLSPDCSIRTPGIRINDLSFADVVRSSNRKEFVFDAYGQRSLIFFPLLYHKVQHCVTSPNSYRQPGMPTYLGSLKVLAHLGCSQYCSS